MCGYYSNKYGNDVVYNTSTLQDRVQSLAQTTVVRQHKNLDDIIYTTIGCKQVQLRAAMQVGCPAEKASPSLWTIDLLNITQVQSCTAHLARSG